MRGFRCNTSWRSGSYSISRSLACSKYADFAADSVAWIGGWEHRQWSIVLPLAISFFTFQQISYLADLSRGKAPIYRFSEFALYICFFPQLIAGPIVRHNEIITQFFEAPKRDGLDERLGRGLTLFVVGLGKKVLLADHLGKIADPVFAKAVARGGHVDSRVLDRVLGLFSSSFTLTSPATRTWRSDWR